MKKKELAEQFRTRCQEGCTEDKEHREKHCSVKKMTDDEIIEDNITCKDCGKKQVTKEELVHVICLSKNPDDFISLCNHMAFLNSRCYKTNENPIGKIVIGLDNIMEKFENVDIDKEYLNIVINYNNLINSTYKGMEKSEEIEKSIILLHLYDTLLNGFISFYNVLAETDEKGKESIHDFMERLQEYKKEDQDAIWFDDLLKTAIELLRYLVSNNDDIVSRGRNMVLDDYNNKEISEKDMKETMEHFDYLAGHKNECLEKIKEFEDILKDIDENDEDEN